MRRVAALIILLLSVAVGVSFAVINADPVKVDFYFGQSQMALSMLLVLALALGAVLGVIASLGLVLRLKTDNAKLRRDARVAKKEVSNLRTLAIREPR